MSGEGEEAYPQHLLEVMDLSPATGCMSCFNRGEVVF